MRDLPPPALRRSEPIPPQQKLLLSFDDVADLSGLSVPTVRSLVRQGLPVVRIGTRCLFRRESVAEFFASRETTVVESEGNADGDPPPVDDG